MFLEKPRFYQNQNQTEFPSNRQTTGTVQKKGALPQQN
jgi:hypothetical protein